MKKKLLSVMLCAAITAVGAAGSAAAADSEKSIAVFVDNRTVCFEDQEPVIEDSRTLVPLRGVLEAMDARVEWNAEQRKVTINSYDNRTRLVLTIDNPEIRKLNFITVTDSELEIVTTDVAPKIINDRTMIPLRVISENMNADVDWNAENYTVNIKTKQYKNELASMASEGVDEETAFAQNTVGITLSADKTEVAKGETVTVTISLDNTAVISDSTITGGSVGVLYDADSFEYLGYETFVGGEEAPAYVGAANPEFKDNSVKAVFLFNPENNYEAADGAFVKFRFIASGDKGGTFRLSDRITNVGYDTSLTTAKNGKSFSISAGHELRIDVTAVDVSIAEKADENSPSDAWASTGDNSTSDVDDTQDIEAAGNADKTDELDYILDEPKDTDIIDDADSSNDVDVE